MRDIHLPPGPPWWPPAPGWWVLAGLVLALSGAGLWWWRRRATRRRADARVLAQLDALLAAQAGAPDTETFAAGVQQLLRRVARRFDARAVHVRGEVWRGILAQVPTDPAVLDRLAQLDAAIYRPQPLDAEAVAQAARLWLRRALAMRPGGQGHA